jgi:hypothetical protein
VSHILGYIACRSDRSIAADAGVVVNVLLSILIGSFSLAMLAPEMQGQSLSHAIHRASALLTDHPFYSHNSWSWSCSEALCNH